MLSGGQVDLSIRHRLPVHLTEQAGSARISPGGHLRSDLVSERVVVWTRLGVRVTRGLPTRKQRRAGAYLFRDEGEGVAVANEIKDIIIISVYLRLPGNAVCT